VLVEQNLPLALAVADTAYVISKGRVVFDGDPTIIRTDDEVRTTYLGI
jgi:ABC-type branched-subunit amino acid transport system ATPase component